MSKLAEWSFSADGDGTAYVSDGKLPIKADVWGSDFGSGTVKLQFSPDAGTTWIDITDASFTANGTIILRHVLGQQLRPSLSGSTSPSINVEFNECVTE